MKAYARSVNGNLIIAEGETEDILELLEDQAKARKLLEEMGTKPNRDSPVLGIVPN